MPADPAQLALSRLEVAPGAEATKVLGGTGEHVVRAPVHAVRVEAEDGDVTLVPASASVHVRVHRDHFVNTPEATEHLARGVLTLRTRCPLGFIGCGSDYRLGIPPGVTVTVDKPSGRVDALAVGGRVTQMREDSEPLRISARSRVGGCTAALSRSRTATEPAARRSSRCS